MTDLPPHRHSGPADRSRGRPGARLTWRRFLVAALALVVLGLGAGVLFSRADPPRAARLVVAELTTTADGPADAAGPDPQLPVTGPQRGSPTCGRAAQPLAAEDQVATLASGVVVVQHDPAVTSAALDRLATRDRVVVAPNPHLADGEVVVATAWRQRMALDRVDADLLDAFVTGHADRAPDVQPCPAAP